MKTLLNLGSGTTNLLPMHYLVHGGPDDPDITYSVYNADIKEAPTTIPNGQRYQKITPGEALPYQDTEFDVILAISPFGFSTINRQTLRALQPGGAFIIVGNSSNPFAARNKKSEAGCQDKVRKVADDEDPELWRTARQVCQTYRSYVSDGSKTTDLNHTEIWRKV